MLLRVLCFQLSICHPKKCEALKKNKNCSTLQILAHPNRNVGAIKTAYVM